MTYFILVATIMLYAILCTNKKVNSDARLIILSVMTVLSLLCLLF